MDKVLAISPETYQDILNIKSGLFYPLTGFMNEIQFNNCAEYGIIGNHIPWTIPINFHLSEGNFHHLKNGDKLTLIYFDKKVAELTVKSKYEINEGHLFKIYGTTDPEHPGIKKELERGLFRCGGEIELLIGLPENCLLPKNTRRIFSEKKWKKIAAFQTRNPIHRAHEHIHRVVLEYVDGLFINPLTGWKKKGDFSEEAVINGYQKQIEFYYPKNRIHFDVLKTQMRYAGPREAVFHALIRRNLGCTHFIIGRDHAGVGNYYGKYEAQEYALSYSRKYDLGIELITPSEPVYCKSCCQMVSINSCGHDAANHVTISGTLIREKLSKGECPDEIFMRKEVSLEIMSLKEQMFI